jgi:NAD(P)-dependent dehydrogenase (short-subunit alcohol dehydrogenase family)
MPAQRTLLFATESEATRQLATAIDADLFPLPSYQTPDTFEEWRADALLGPHHDRIVVASGFDDATHSTLPPGTPPPPRTPASARVRGELISLDEKGWRQRFELPYLLWSFALGAAGQRCADGGAVVAVVQTPAALDAPGWTPEFAIADGVFALVRSVAAAEGPRGVRANLVTTPIGLVEGDLVAPAPPLPGFPGTIDGHVAGAIRTFLSSDAIGLTGRVLSADGGRSL